jgi:hypothetical protein
MTELEKYLFGNVEEKDSFQVDTLDKANWAITKAFDAEHYIEHIKRRAEVMRQRLDKWVEKATKEAEETVDRMQKHLEPYVSLELQKKKSRSIKLLNGTAGFRSSEKISIPDGKEKNVLEKLKADHPEAVRIKEEIDKKALAKLIKDGEDIPNVSLQKYDRFYIKEGTE